MSPLWSALLAPYPQVSATQGEVLNDLEIEARAASIVTPLLSQGVLSVSGAEASKFLQGQTTTDFRTVTEQDSRLGCYVSLKGRAITSYRAVQQGDTIHLVMDAGLVGPTRDRLGKFIVFSKATLRTEPTPALIGLAGPEATTLLSGLLDSVPEAADAVVHNEHLSAVRLPGEQRFLLLVNPESLGEVWQGLSGQATPAGENAWRLRQIEAGVAQVTVASTELFQPQELNYQILNGLSYNKGCYTGQEIVARLYFRGKLKQHLRRFAVVASTLPAPGAALFAEGKHVADVVQAARRDVASVELLAIARPEHIEALHLADVEGPLLTPQPLPYTVPEPE